MTHLQLQLAKTYEDSGYKAVLLFWASKQEEILNLAKNERGKLKNMMRRYCLMNGDMESASKVVREDSVPQNKEIMPLLFEFGKTCYLEAPTEKNKAESERIYSLIQQHGSPEDLFHLGEMYMSGTETEQNYVKAAECLKKSAMDGNRCAQFILGEMYSIGRGVDKNRAEAEKWYMAANGENSQYATSLTKMVIPDGITVIEASAFEEFESLRSVKIPASVKRIGDRAFFGCKGLEQIELANTKIVLGANAFNDCDSLNEDSKKLLNETDYVFVKGNNEIEDFFIGRYQITQELYEKIMGNNPSCFKGDKNPVENFSLDDAFEFCNRLSKRDGFKPCFPCENRRYTFDIMADGYRLPTEAEWKFAARGKKTFRYSGGCDLDEVAWYSENSNETTHPVGTKKPNALGIYDMSGNVWEWCRNTDSYPEYVYCGGAYNCKQDCCAINNTRSKTPGYYDHIGFRVVRSYIPNDDSCEKEDVSGFRKDQLKSTNRGRRPATEAEGIVRTGLKTMFTNLFENQNLQARDCSPYYCVCGDYVTKQVQKNGRWVCPSCDREKNG
jgi:formylglycine-generating enzyme required for sulfatase activity